jgi:hypothetical protein
LQEVVDDLAARICRTVYVDDPRFRVLAYSTHYEKPDAMRIRALAERGVTPEIHDQLLRLGVPHWREPTMLPADPASGMDYPRWCVPVLTRWGTAGQLWVSAADPLDEDAAAEVLSAIDQVRQEILRISDEGERDRIRDRTLLADIASSDRARRADALDRLHDRPAFAAATHIIAVVSTPLGAVIAPDGELTPERAATAVRRSTARLAPDTIISSVADDGILAIVAARATSDPRAIGRAFAAAARDVDITGTGTVRFGIGGPHPDAPSAFEQARTALRTPRDPRDPIAIWAADPTAAWLAATLRLDVPDHLEPEVFRRLADHGDDTLDLVEAFLCYGGKIPAVAALLHLHRATVYERVRRFEAASGLDLRDGSTRLALQVWFARRGARRHSSPADAVTADESP